MHNRARGKFPINYTFLDILSAHESVYINRERSLWKLSCCIETTWFYKLITSKFEANPLGVSELLWDKQTDKLLL